jgi:hypothetical protein
MKRHPCNTNLTLFPDHFFNGFRVYTERGPLVLEYLERLQQVLQASLQDYARVFAFRVDLHFPYGFAYQDESYANAVVERFIASLRAKVGHNRAMASRTRSGVHRTNIRFVWVREFGITGEPHYHLLILMNADAFSSLGDFVLGRDNMYNRVVEAWGSALGVPCDDIETLVHFPENPVYWLRRGDLESYQALFYRASYFCKADTKRYPDRGHAFGYSRS